MLAQQVLEALKARGWRMATAESCTGGLIGAAITECAGSSAVFDRGFVTYSNAAKIDCLGVSQRLILDHGAVSTEVAAAMAKGALHQADAHVAVAVTGIAGPGGSDHKPEGRVCFGLATQSEAHSEQVDFGAIGRANVRAATVDHALRLILACATQ